MGVLDKIFQVKEKPRLDWMDVVGAAAIYIGFLMFLIALHLMAIDETGNTADVLSTAFTVFLRIYVTAVIFGLAGIIIQLLRWLTWSVTIPDWKKEQDKQSENLR